MEPRESHGYFAAQEAQETVNILIQKGKDHYSRLHSNRYLDKLRLMWRGYHGVYGDYNDNHEISFVGEQGELVNLPVNHFRNIARHIFNLITATRPIMEARAVNTDYKSLAQTYLASSILEYYMREKGLEDIIKKSVEYAVVLGCGFIRVEWNESAGKLISTDADGNNTFEGDLQFNNLSPFDVVHDGTKDTWDNDWLLVRSKRNKYDLIAKYPDLKDKIEGVKTIDQNFNINFQLFSNDSTDDVYIFEFFHKQTESLPEGRYILFIDNQTVLIDQGMPYRTIPIFRISAGEILGTPYAYSPLFDLYPLQEAINSTYSTILTNQNAFGVGNVYIPDGSNIAVSTLHGGLNLIQGSHKPEAINLTETPKEIFEFLEMLIQSQETLSGINSVTRGNPEASLRSGSALALVQSMSIQYVSSLEQSYVRLIENVGSNILEILKDYAKSPKIVTLVGKYNRTYLKEFTGEDLDSISRVIVDVGNPLSRCLAKDTPVLMFDGSIKMVQNIKIGEQIMGPDSYPRTIGNVNSGTEMMYEVTSKDSNRNIKYGCNESHILTLKYCSDDYRYDAKKGDILDITIRDYLKLTHRQQRLLQGFTTGVEFEKKELPIPPYILGAWIGDGSSRSTCLTTMDKEMVDEWSNYADQIGMKIRITENKQPNKSRNYYITSGESHGSSDRNPFMNGLRDLELFQNKHIPQIYLKSSREDRLNLLAGLIDTDGHRIDETFIFTQKSERTTNDVIFLAKSLGFRVTVKKFKSNSSKLVGQIDSECFKVSIGGNTHEIPTRLPRKRALEKEKVRDWLNYGINVTQIGIGTYYGFTLVEEPHFLLGDFTVTHNTIAGRVQMAEQLLQMGLIKNAEQYIMVQNTGRLDSSFEGDMSQLLCIKKENEYLMSGQEVIALSWDSHKEHILEHRAVISDPDLRQDPTVRKAVTDHVQEHIDFLRIIDPDLLSLLGEQPLMPLDQLMSQGKAPDGPGSGSMAPNGGPIIPPMPPPQPPMPQGMPSQGLPPGMPMGAPPMRNIGPPMPNSPGPNSGGPLPPPQRMPHPAHQPKAPRPINYNGNLIPPVPGVPKIPKVK